MGVGGKVLVQQGTLHDGIFLGEGGRQTMKTRSFAAIILFFQVLLITAGVCSCGDEEQPVIIQTPEVESTEEPALTPSPTFTPEISLTPSLTVSPTQGKIPADYQPAFGIDYSQPDLYLEQGQQCINIDPEVAAGLDTGEQSFYQLTRIHFWLRQEFEHYSARGSTIGVATAAELIEEARLGGCHDYALVFISVVRELGYPAVFVDTVSLEWVRRVQEGTADSKFGHTFVEVFLDGSWILVDPTNGWFIRYGYEPGQPVIPIEGPLADSSQDLYGYVVQWKALDIWDAGMYEPQEYFEGMEEFARELDLGSVEYPDYEIDNFDPARR